MRSLSVVIHGEPGTGKSWAAATSPAPRLILDAEGGSRFAPGTKVYWDPMAEPPPVPGQGRTSPLSEVVAVDWTTCIVQLNDFAMMDRAYQWLNAGAHPFKSVVVDSITELQKRVVDQTSGVAQPTQQDWGAILRLMEDQVRKLRDLLFHKTNPLECVVLIALSHLRDGKFRPFVKGQLELTLPGFIDVVGYLYVETGADGQLVRRMLVAPLGDIDAKDRTDAITKHFGPTVENPNLAHIVDLVEYYSNPANTA